MKPLLLMDVDGVLCPFGQGWRQFDGAGIEDEFLLEDLRKQDYPGYVLDEIHGVHISEENKKRLSHLSTLYEPHWCTGWIDKANEVIAPLHGLPEWPVVPLNTLSFDIHWKFKAIEKYVGDKPYAFVDDDINDSGLRYAQERSRTIPTLWLPVNSNEGLTDDHVKKLEEFAESVNECVEA